MYNEYVPNPLLAPYIETYWVSSGFLLAEETSRILPDGCVDIIFSIANGAQNSMQPLLPYIVGTATIYTDVPLQGEVKMLGIRFRPGGITALTRMAVSDFTNQSIDIQLCDTILEKSFSEIIVEKKTTEERLEYIDNYFIQKLESFFEVDERATYAAFLIEQSKGNISIPVLADKSCLSERQFERRFKSAIGISAKTFSRVTKFNHTRHYLRANPEQSLFQSAIECGYTDHSHLTKEFKLLSGSLPR